MTRSVKGNDGGRTGRKAGPKRSYDTSRRRAFSDATRRHVIDVATPRFSRQGYERTSMRDLAEAAGVSIQTLYNAFGSKFGLFSAVMDVVIAGDHRPEAIAERAPVRTVDSITDADELLDQLVALATEVLERLRPLYPTLRGAALSAPEVAAAHERFTLQGRLDDLRPFVRRLVALGALDPDLDEGRATDVVWTLLSPDVYELLVGHRGWSPDEFGAWARTMLADALLV